MNISLGIVYKKFLDQVRSSKFLLEYLWGIKVEDKVFIYLWDVVTANFKKVIDKNIFANYSSYLDMGCGHIAILGVYVKKKYPHINVTSVDFYQEFINNAEITSKMNSTKIIFYKSDLFKKLKKKYDCITFNPPYKRDMLKNNNNLIYQKTTYSGKDGLDTSRAFLEEAKKYLTVNGRIFLGINNFFVTREDCLKMIKSTSLVLVKEHKKTFNTSTIYELKNKYQK